MDRKIFYSAAMSFMIVPLCFASTQSSQRISQRKQELPQRPGRNFHAEVSQITINNNSDYEIKLFANVIMPKGINLQFPVPSASMNYESSGPGGSYMTFQLENGIPGILPGKTITMAVNTSGMSSWKVFAKINGKWLPQPVLEVNDKPLAKTVTITGQPTAGMPVFQFDMH